MAATLTLKSDTRALHHQLDHHPTLHALMSKDVSIEDYQVALEQLGPWFLAIENTFYALWPAYANVRAKSPLIEADLANIKSHPVKLTPAQLYGVPPATSEAFAVGVMYVCEGSSLGGVVLSRHLKQHLRREDIFSFYHCYGSGLSEHWLNIQTIINEKAISQSELSEQLEGACWAFSSLYHHLCSYKNEPVYAAC